MKEIAGRARGERNEVLPEKETQPIVGFEQMDLSKEILQAVDKMGFSQPTPVQGTT